MTPNELRKLLDGPVGYVARDVIYLHVPIRDILLAALSDHVSRPDEDAEHNAYMAKAFPHLYPPSAPGPDLNPLREPEPSCPPHVALHRRIEDLETALKFWQKFPHAHFVQCDQCYEHFERCRAATDAAIGPPEPAPAPADAPQTTFILKERSLPDQVAYSELAALRADCERISIECGLLPSHSPAPGVMKKICDDNDALRARVKELEEDSNHAQREANRMAREGDTWKIRCEENGEQIKSLIKECESYDDRLDKAESERDAALKERDRLTGYLNRFYMQGCLAQAQRETVDRLKAELAEARSERGLLQKAAEIKEDTIRLLEADAKSLKAELADAQEQRDELKYKLTNMGGRCREAAAQARREERERLRPWIGHFPGCGYYRRGDGGECTCGMLAALEGGGE